MGKKSYRMTANVQYTMERVVDFWVDAKDPDDAMVRAEKLSAEDLMLKMHQGEDSLIESEVTYLDHRDVDEKDQTIGRVVAISTLVDMLSLVSVQVSRATVKSWSLKQREQAEKWAGRESLAASDNPVRRLKRPAHVPAPTSQLERELERQKGARKR
jgi:hypothetical protein